MREKHWGFCEWRFFQRSSSMFFGFLLNSIPMLNGIVQSIHEMLFIFQSFIIFRSFHLPVATLLVFPYFSFFFLSFLPSFFLFFFPSFFLRREYFIISTMHHSLLSAIFLVYIPRINFPRVPTLWSHFPKLPHRPSRAQWSVSFSFGGCK